MPWNICIMQHISWTFSIHLVSWYLFWPGKCEGESEQLEPNWSRISTEAYEGSDHLCPRARHHLSKYHSKGDFCQKFLFQGLTLTLSALIDGKNFNQGGHKVSNHSINTNLTCPSITGELDIVSVFFLIIFNAPVRLVSAWSLIHNSTPLNRQLCLPGISFKQYYRFWENIKFLSNWLPSLQNYFSIFLPADSCTLLKITIKRHLFPLNHFPYIAS